MISTGCTVFAGTSYFGYGLQQECLRVTACEAARRTFAQRCEREGRGSVARYQKYFTFCSSA